MLRLEIYSPPERKALSYTIGFGKNERMIILK